MNTNIDFLKLASKSYPAVLIVITGLLMFISGCSSDEFKPNVDLVNDVAIHCILDNRTENTIVRVQQVYLDNTPVDMSKYKVTLSEPFENEYELKDTIISQSPNTRFFTLPSKYVKRGTVYMLTLYKNNKSIKWAICKTFSKMSDWSLLETFEEPKAGGPMKWNLELRLPKSNHSVIFLYKMVVKYEYQSGSDRSQKYTEIPMDVQISQTDPEYSVNKYIYEYNYDKLNKTYIHLHNFYDKNTYQTKDKPNYSYISYDGYNTKACLVSLKKNAPSNIVIKGVYALYYSIDYTYYQYYMETGNSSNSIRLDQVSYHSNIQSPNGESLGFFGTISCDTLNVKVPEFLINDCGYVNGQK